MGVIPIEQRTVRAGGTTWELDANTTTDDMSRSDGTIQILVRRMGDSEWTHCCHAPVQRAGDKFINKFADAFAADQAFRDYCERADQWEGSPIDQDTEWGQRLPKLPAAPSSKSRGQIARLIKMGKKAKFRDYASLKSGRDEFSSKKEPYLRELLGSEANQLDHLDAQKEQPLEAAEKVKVLRWMARGLPANMAHRKVLTDLEIAKNSKGRK